MYTRMPFSQSFVTMCSLQSRGFAPTLEDEKVHPKLITNEVIFLQALRVYSTLEYHPYLARSALGFA